jgi:flagellar hook protein FlgE
MTSISNIALSGIRAAETRFAVRAENIANANNAGYTALRAEQISTAIGPVVRVSKTDKPRPQEPQQPDIDLAEELVDLIFIKYDFRASAKVLQTADQISGSLLDILA